MFVLRIYRGNPTPANLKAIGEMLEKGIFSGLNSPEGVDWKSVTLTIEP